MAFYNSTKMNFVPLPVDKTISSHLQINAQKQLEFLCLKFNVRKNFVFESSKFL